MITVVKCGQCDAHTTADVTFGQDGPMIRLGADWALLGVQEPTEPHARLLWACPEHAPYRVRADKQEG